jgi:hypothetical protein
VVTDADEGEGKLAPRARPLNPARFWLIDAACFGADIGHSLGDGLHANEPVLVSFGFDARYGEL